jgi:hypothetical protein
LSIAAFAVYAALAARDVMFGDALELVASAAHNGIAHPPGYPLWIVLAHLATLAPIGSLPYRANLTAGAFHAVTVGLVYAAGYVLVRRHAPALFAATLLAIGSPLFVTWSLQAEVFSLNDLFAAAIVLLCLLWLEDARRWRLVVPIAFLFGLGLSNQQTLILLAPLPLWVAWCGRDAIRSAANVPQTLAIAVLLLLLAFWLPYLHTILASRRLEGWQFGEARTFSELIDVIDRRVYGTLNLVRPGRLQGGSAVERVATFVLLGGWPYLAIAAGLVGLALRKRYKEIVFAALIVSGPLLAFCAVANLSVDFEIWRSVFSRFGLMPLVTLAPFSACAVFFLEAVVRNRPLRTIVIAVALCAAFVPAALRLPALSLAGVHGPRTLSRDIFAALPPHAILLANSDVVALAPTYFKATETWRPDVTVVINGALTFPSYRNGLARAIEVPPQIGRLEFPFERRDVLARANPSRPFFVASDRSDLTAPSLSYESLAQGVVSQIIPRDARSAVREHYAREVALQSRPGYADVSEDSWKSNGFGREVRTFYAEGFLATALDARHLADQRAARYWFARATAYASGELLRTTPPKYVP